jgi:hypothetical protein
MPVGEKKRYSEALKHDPRKVDTGFRGKIMLRQQAKAKWSNAIAL